MAAFCVLVEALVVVFSRVVLRLTVGVVGFAVGGIVDACGVRGCVTLIWFSPLSVGSCSVSVAALSQVSSASLPSSSRYLKR